MNGQDHFHNLFEYAPISLWEEDYTEIKHFLDRLRTQGVLDLRKYLDENPQQITACMDSIKVLDVNRQTLEMFHAGSTEELLRNLGKVFRADMRHHFRDELMEMWNGSLAYEKEGINYSLTGEPLHIRLHWRVLPGSEKTFERVLVAIENITLRKQAEQALEISESHYRGMFDHSPISLWEEDYSALKANLDRLRAEGVQDLREYLADHPEAIGQNMAAIRVLDVNRRTLEMFKAASREELIAHLPNIFRDEMQNHFRDELVNIWEGRLAYEQEGINYGLDGAEIQIHLNWSVLPGFEASLGRVLIAIQDVTARKKAEEYLRYLGTHDVLTKLYNRAFFEEEFQRFEHSRYFPISVVIADLDRLKFINDHYGHLEGDKIIRRAAEVLQASFRQEDIVARIGGDEFAILLPNTQVEAAMESLTRIQELVDLNNKFYQGPRLSISLGAATGDKNQPLDAIFREADDRMYAEKRIRHKLFEATGKKKARGAA